MHLNPPPPATRIAANLARQHGIDLRLLKRGSLVITVDDVIKYLSTRSPTRKSFGRYASHFVPHSSKIRLYQWEIVKRMEGRSGFVIAPCGSGKTLIGLLIAVLNGGRFLILTTRYADQWKATLQEFFTGIDSPAVIVAGEKAKANASMPNVVISTYNAFYSNSDRFRLEKQLVYTTVILDEAHAAASPLSLKMIDRISAVHWCALTATKVREDEELKKLEMRIGSTEIEIDRQRLVDEGFVTDVDVTHLLIPYDDAYGLEKVLGRQTALALHPNKIQALVHLLRVSVQREKYKTIVFCDDLFCLEWVNAIIRASNLPVVGCISMNTPHITRTSAILAFESSSDPVILIVSRTGDEALDVPSANAGIVFWNHWASRRQIVQRIGRLSRKKNHNLPAVFYVLLADDPHEIRASEHRKEYLHEHGFNVEDVALADSSFAFELRTGQSYAKKLCEAKSKADRCKSHPAIEAGH